MEITEPSREELVMRLFQSVLSDGSYEVLGVNLPSYEMPEWITYELVDIVARNRAKRGRIVFGIALTSRELTPPRRAFENEKRMENTPAGRWIRSITSAPLTYPTDQLGNFPDLVIGIERQNEEDLLHLLRELDLSFQLGNSIFIEIL